MAPTLPEKLVEDIILRLPVKSLLRFKTASKNCYSLITKDVEFAKRHLIIKQSSSSKNIHLFLHQNQESKTIVLNQWRVKNIDEADWSEQSAGQRSIRGVKIIRPDANPLIEIKFPDRIPSKNPRVVGSANGLICVVLYRNIIQKGFFLWNPSTGECRRIISSPMSLLSSSPSWRRDYFVITGFCYDSYSDDYKIVGSCRYQGLVIFSLKENSWRLHEHDEYSDHLVDRAIFFNGAFHWCLGRQIIAFHLSKEKFFGMKIPKQTKLYPNKVKLFEYLGFLCLFDYGSLWMMKEYGAAKSWVKLRTKLPGVIGSLITSENFLPHEESLISPKSLVKMEKEDPISALPEPLIQHILSFLPSANEAIRTTILSKSFHNQWTHNPVLKLNSSGMSCVKFSKFIYNTLLVHDCSKIPKFHIQQSECCNVAFLDCPIRNWDVEFGIKKHVEEVLLEKCFGRLPEFLFDNAYLVKLHTYKCHLGSLEANVRDRSLGYLKTLKIKDCTLSPKMVENILRGSPSLEFLELTHNYSYRGYIIASKSLKKMVLEDARTQVLEISCPNLEELKLFGFLRTNVRVSLGHLKTLKIENCTSRKTITNILCGSPSLEFLELTCNHESSDYVIASKCLKKLVLKDARTRFLEISCPNLDELKLFGSLVNLRVSNLGHLKTLKIENCILSPKTIQNILCGSPSLEFLELTRNYEYRDYVIASKSLKKLVLEDARTHVLEISCPNLEELKLLGCFYVENVPIMNSSSLRSLTSVTLDFDFEYFSYHGYNEIEIIRQLQHAKELKFGSRFIQVLSNLHEAGLSLPLLNNECLTLDNPVFPKHHGGVVCALRSLHKLEKLVIKLPAPVYKSQSSTRSYWNTKESRVSECLLFVPHLKIIEIIGLSEHDDTYSFLLNFIEVLVENAISLEKLVVNQWLVADQR